jgi:hypothetical protein
MSCVSIATKHLAPTTNVFQFCGLNGILAERYILVFSGTGEVIYVDSYYERIGIIFTDDDLNFKILARLVVTAKDWNCDV